MNRILIFLLAIILISGGVMHFIRPEVYNPFIPDTLPKLAVNYATGIVEIVLGIGLLTTKYRRLAAGGVFLLMIAFLPLHVMDVFADQPAIGSKTLAYIRLPLQFVLIYWPWYIRKHSR
ncbi:MAG: hypothetical protein QE487_15120 [Fluviicola sp.]|nr:hypothetical protein [Fluviicola sp.]